MDFNIPPYYDDYDEAKKFLRVLFRPGYAVQARELTQLQTILQEQVSRVGDFIFKNKSRVIPGDVNHQACSSIKIEPLEIDTAVNADTLITGLEGYTIVGSTTGVRGVVMLGEKSDTTGEPPLLYAGILSNGTNGENVFAQNEIIVVSSGTTSYRFRIQNVSTAINLARIATIDTGVFYVNGFFVQVDKQTISLSKYTADPTCSVGLDIVEQIVTPEEDTSLLDNSVGSPNYTAPGAHRFKIQLNLVKRDINYAADSYIDLLRIRRGNPEFKLKDNDLAYLQDILAKRTYEESGDYVVDPFELEMREHRNSDQGQWVAGISYQEGDVVYYNNGTSLQYYLCLDNGVSGPNAPTHTNGVGSDGGVRWRYTIAPKYDYGLYTLAQGGDTNKIAFGLKSGSAYVKGYEFRTYGTTYIDAEKPREYAQITDTSVPVTLGNTIDVRMFGTPDVDNLQIVDLFKMDVIPPDGTNMGIIVSNGANSFANVYTVSGTYTPYAAGAKLGYIVICESSGNYYVDKLKADGYTTTTQPRNFMTPTTSAVWVPYLATSKIGTARIRYCEPYNTVNGRTTAKISLMDIQMNPGEDFKKVRVIGTPLSLGSTANGGDPNCFRALVLPTAYNSTSVGSASISTTGGFGTGSLNWSDMTSNLTGQGTKWTSGATLTSGDVVWFQNDPTQFFFVRSLTNGTNTIATDNQGIVVNNASYQLSGNLMRADCAFENPKDYDGLFDLPKSGAYTLRGGANLDEQATNYVALERYTASSTATDPISLTISATYPDEFVTAIPSQYIVMNGASGESLTVTSVTLSSNTSATLSISASGSISNAIANLQSKTFNIYAPTKKKLFSAKEKTKALKTQILNINLQSTIEQEVISLFKADIFRLLKIEMFPNTIFGNDISTVVSGTGIDITNQYTLDDGQRDTHYDLGRILKGKAFPFPTGPIRVTFEYFEHSAGDYLSVDSYVDLLYEEIPTYKSKVTGKTRNLKDVLDFRPRMNDAGTFDSGTSSTSSLPLRVYPVTLDMAYFLGRKDAIILERGGSIKLIKGIASDNPQQPALPTDTMVLYDIDYRPYVDSVDSLNVRVKEHNHKRYTMRDIGKIEARVQNIEQVTTLNLLEKETAALNIKDQDGLDRFKNGFVVDNFKGHTTGNPLDADYECSIDIDNRELRPAFAQVGIDLIEKATTLAERTTLNYRMHEGNLITLPYYTGAEYYYKTKNEIAQISAKGSSATSTELFRKESLTRDLADLVIVENPYATESTQIALLLGTQASGTVTLVPSSDSWVEEQVPPELVINEGGTYDSVAAAADAFGIDFGTIWNGWQISNVGTPVTTTTSGAYDSWNGWVLTRATVTTSVTSRTVTETNTGNSVGINESTGKKEIAGRLTARQSISYIRSRPVVFIASGLRASTRMYTFMDQTPVTEYCTQATRLILAARKPNYSVTPYQFGTIADARNVYETFNTDVYFGSELDNYERTFAGTISSFDTTTATTSFTSVYNGDVKAVTNLQNVDKTLNDTARDIIAPNAQVTAFQRGEVIIGETSGTTAIVILHEQSVNSVTGEPDGLADVLHVVNIRPKQGSTTTTGFSQGEVLRGTLSRTTLGGQVLKLQLRGTAAIESSVPGALVTTGTGRIAGVYMLTSGQVINNRASPKFLTGKRVFTITDSATNDKNSRLSIADTLYEAVGIIDAGKGSYIGVRNGQIATGPARADRQYTVQNVTQSVSYQSWDFTPPPARGGDGGGGTDPLAQTFVSTIDGEDGKDGCFIRELEIFFKAKDSTLPVIVELRTVNSDGSPTTTVLPYGRVVLYPSDIVTDSTGTLGTVVRFLAPVHIINGVRYAVVLVTGSPKYEVWSATLGKADVSKNKMGSVVKQPSLGSFFKSKNGESWVESPESNLKVNIFRCIFNTAGTLTSPSVVTLYNKDIEPLSNSGRTSSFSKFSVNPFRAKLNSTEVIVTQPNHGFSVGSYVSFQNVTGSSNFGFSDSDINSSSLVSEVYNAQNSALTAISGFKAHKVIKVYSHDRYSIRITNSTGSFVAATSTGSFGGTDITGTRNVLYTVMHPTINMMTLPNTTVTGNLYTTSGKSPHGSEVPYIKDSSPSTVVLNDNNYLTTQRTVLNRYNEAQNLGRANSLELKLELSTTNRFVSPVIDLDRANVICVQNRIDDPVTLKSGNTNYYNAVDGTDGSDIYFSEYENKNGAVQASYVTRKLQFNNSSKLLKVQVAANIPSNTGIDKTTSTVTLPFKFANGARISDHPAVIAQRTAANTLFATGSTAITLQSAAGIAKGMYVYGPGIQKGTRVVTASTSLVIDKSLKENLPSTATGGTVLFFSAIDISSMFAISQIDVGDYLSLPTGISGITTGTYVISAPHNMYFTRKAGSYSTGSFVPFSTTSFTFSTTLDRNSGWIDPSSNNFTLFLDSVSDIKVGTYAYINNAYTTDGTFTFAPKTIRRVVQVNTTSKSIVLQTLWSTASEYDATGFGTTFTFNANNTNVTFFDPRIRISNATTAAIDPANDATSGNLTNQLTFTTPPNDVVEVYAKISSSGNSTSTNAYTFTSSTGVASNIITLGQTHNLNLGSPVTYYGENNVVTGLTNGQTYYAIVGSDFSLGVTQIKLATTVNNALSGTAITLTATTPAETHRIIDINQKDAASIDDDQYFRILPDLAVGGGDLTYGGSYSLASKGQLVTADNPTQFIDHSFTVDNLSPFTTAIIKIVMRSRNPAYVPKLKDLRIIASA